MTFGPELSLAFTVHSSLSDRTHRIDESDIRIVLGRLPRHLTASLRHIHLNDRSKGARYLGYVNRGRREIALCALPPRISLTRFLSRGDSPGTFGAHRAKPWPTLAVRRFMLYEVLLHEIGHLQLVRPRLKYERRRFAMEPLADKFAGYWRRLLWSTRFESDDPAHNPPTPDEIADPDPELSEARRLAARNPSDGSTWQRLGKIFRKRRLLDEAVRAFQQAHALTPRDAWNLMYLGNCAYSRKDATTAIEMFQKAALLLPESAGPIWCLAESYESVGSVEQADHYYQRAVQLDPYDTTARRKLEEWQSRRPTEKMELGEGNNA